MLSYGRVITEEVYRDGVMTNRVQHVEMSNKLTSLQQLWDNLIEQVARLKTEDSINFTIECDAITREPNRMIVNGKQLLK